jgi:ATP-binding cassette, subfamily B, bacterial HlyB/CyaB
LWGEGFVEEINRQEQDHGILSLVIAARILGVPAEYDQLFYCVPHENREIGLLRAAQDMGLKSKLVHTDISHIAKMAFPIIAVLQDSDYGVIIKADEKHLLVFDCAQKRPMTLTYEKFASTWTGRLILLAKKFKLADLSKEFNFKWFLPVLYKFRNVFSQVLLASFFIQCFGLITPLFSQVIIDKVLVHRGVSTLDILVIGLFVINVFEYISGILRSYLFSHTTNRVDVILGSKLFKHLLALPLKYFELRRIGDTVARVRELENIRQFLTGTALTVVLDTFFTIVFVIAMFFYSVPLSFVVLASLPFFILLSVIVTPILRARLQHKFTCGAEVQSFLVETVGGIHTVKSLAVEPQMNQKWEGFLANYAQATFKSNLLGTVAGSTAQIIQKMTTLGILWFGAHYVMDGEMTLGQLIAFQMISGRVIDPILRLANLWQSFQQVRLSVERLGDVLNCPTEPMFNPNKTLLPPLKGHVVMEDISFRYRIDGRLTLDGINMDIKPGMCVGVVGRSGSGKSTLTKLIQRLYLPEKGRILIDNIDLNQVEPAWLRRQIGVVLQENFLFNGSIRENIATAVPGASMERIIRVAKLAGAHEFILELPEGYDTAVGERGTTLSGGQRQRIAIARTLLTNPRILIFDEATSALDNQSERIIQQNLKQICQGRTVYMIAHRLTTIQHADTIIYIDKGKIMEQGSHAELMKKQGLYYRLYTQQGVME